MARTLEFVPVKLSLADLLGENYILSAVSANAALTGRAVADLRRLVRRKVDFLPAAVQRQLVRLLPKVGQRITKPLADSPAGASSERFNAATKTAMAPLSGFGYYRVGENGRLYFLSKSEHYHAALGHAFPGYRLLEIARGLGIPNATHNNTRGYITRRLEEELIRIAGGKPGSPARRSTGGPSLTRVLNLETGSLAAEAGFKLMLARFFQPQNDATAPRYAGRVPVFIVLADDRGGLLANYHGTTIFTQMLRGMWPGLARAMQGDATTHFGPETCGTAALGCDSPARGGGDRPEGGPIHTRGGCATTKMRCDASPALMKIVAVRPNDVTELESAFARYDRGRFKVAGLACELVMMNYGARVLSKPFVQRAEQLCRRHDAPLMIDEIQTCLWSPRLLMFREYGVRPDIVAVGKGFPGGEYPASRLLFTEALDCLPQFGALVTNGQEELASLAYLVTMQWAEANAAVTAAIGEDFESRLRELAGRFPKLLSGIAGRRHMQAMCFHDMAPAQAFVRRMVESGLDISVQSYKAVCPPAALTKLPLIAGRDAVNLVLGRIEAALKAC